jgi:hypothetical protein
MLDSILRCTDGLQEANIDLGSAIRAIAVGVDLWGVELDPAKQEWPVK